MRRRQVYGLADTVTIAGLGLMAGLVLAEFVGWLLALIAR